MKILKGDILIIIAVLTAAAGIFFIAASAAESGGFVEVSINSELYGEYPLFKNQTVQLDDFMTIQIKDGYVFTEDVDCPNKICEHTGKINKKGHTIICLPNRVFITIK